MVEHITGDIALRPVWARVLNGLITKSRKLYGVKYLCIPCNVYGGITDLHRTTTKLLFIR